VFSATAILFLSALIRRFPYAWPAKTHTWIAAAYLALVFHTISLVKADYWCKARANWDQFLINP
jgi:predicted ferric reductase